MTSEEFVKSIIVRYRACNKEKEIPLLFQKCSNQKYVEKQAKYWRYLFRLFEEGIIQHFDALENTHRYLLAFT